MGQLTVKPEIDFQEGVDLYQSRSQAAIAALGQKGFNPPNQPVYATQAGRQYYQGELPADLTTLTDDHLGGYMGLLSEWNGYVQYQLAEADSQLLHAKAQLAFIEAKLRIAYKYDEEGKKRSNPERDDHVGSDRRYLEVNSQVIYWETFWRYTKAVAFKAEQSFAAVSRRITQRGQSIDRDRTTGNVTGHVNLPQGPLFGGSRRT
jgi:hypothetical protein